MESSFSPNVNKIKLNKQPPLKLSLKKDKNLFILPPIDIETKKNALIKPTSILTKFIHDRTKKLIKSTKEELKQPIKINLEKIKNLKKSKIIDNNQNSSNIFITENQINKEFDSNSFLNDNNELNNNNNNIYSFSNENNILNTNKRNINLNNIDNLSSLSVDHKII